MLNILFCYTSHFSLSVCFFSPSSVGSTMNFKFKISMFACAFAFAHTCIYDTYIPCEFEWMEWFCVSNKSICKRIEWHLNTLWFKFTTCAYEMCCGKTLFFRSLDKDRLHHLNTHSRRTFSPKETFTCETKWVVKHNHGSQHNAVTIFRFGRYLLLFIDLFVNEISATFSDLYVACRCYGGFFVIWVNK